jgi:RecA-family ATPase
MQLDLPTQIFIVAQLLAAGLAVLAGAPKMGKSWLVLHLALAIASGQRALGLFEVQQGEVLCLAFEDGRGRLQNRLKIMLHGGVAPSALHFCTEWPRWNDGGKEALRTWLEAHPDARLVIIDTIARLRPPRDTRDFYTSDYDQMCDVKKIADEFGICILLVHHTTKLVSDDPLKNVSGSMGMTGAADVVLVLNRERNTDAATLFVTGRDVEENRFALRFEKETATWVCEGEAPNNTATRQPTPNEEKVLSVLARIEPATATEWETECKKEGVTRPTFFAIKKMFCKSGQVVADRKGKGAKFSIRPHGAESEDGAEDESDAERESMVWSDSLSEDDQTIPSPDGVLPEMPTACKPNHNAESEPYSAVGTREFYPQAAYEAAQSERKK